MGGHFMCTRMKWFFGLRGLSCFNCGQDGHHGAECKRPSLDICIKDKDIALEEIERAEEDKHKKNKLKRQGDKHAHRNEKGNKHNRDKVYKREKNAKNTEYVGNKYKKTTLNDTFQQSHRNFRKIHHTSSYGMINLNNFSSKTPRGYKINKTFLPRRL